MCLIYNTQYLFQGADELQKEFNTSDAISFTLGRIGTRVKEPP